MDSRIVLSVLTYLLLAVSIICNSAIANSHQGTPVGAVGEPPGGLLPNLTGPQEKSKQICHKNKTDVPIAAKFNGGTYVHKVQFFCAPVSKRGPAKTHTYVSSYGAKGGNHSRTGRCPEGFVLSGIKVRGHTYVDRINSIRCTKFNSSTTKFINIGVGGRGGNHTVRMYCRGKERLNWASVFSGAWMDRLELWCK